MNVLIVDSWLREYLKTKASAKEMGRILPLCGPAVERVLKKGDDWVYDIEITTNRPDTASILGIAREAAAILPRNGQTAKLVLPKIKTAQLPTKGLPLKVTIEPKSICPRFTAIVLDEVTIKPSPKLVQERLIKSGLRPLNNIIDISNYLMLETGQPIHTFDYDKIGKATMKVRLSKKGERVVTLDDQTRALPGGDIVIEDGDGRLIDLCGLMGAKNSAIDEKTKRVLFFVQSYDPVLIRRTSLTIGHRTEAAIRFEKGVDEEGIMSVLWQGVELAKKWAGAKPGSKVTDLYPQAYQPKSVTTTVEFVNERLGVELTGKEIKLILDSLGLETTLVKNQLTSQIPSWRGDDLNIPEDLVEEVARIYGYHNLPSVLPPLTQEPPLRTQKLDLESQLKHHLKNWGFSEVYNYSFISDELVGLIKSETKPVRLSNPLTEEWVWLRPSLVPSLLNNLKNNQDKFDQLRIFEMANTYQRQTADLPEEKLILAGLMTGTDFGQLKGVVVQLLAELGIQKPNFTPLSVDWLDKNRAAAIEVGEVVGQLGQLSQKIGQKLELKQTAYLFVLDLAPILQKANQTKSFTPIPTHPPVIEDLTFVFPHQVPVGEVIESILALSPLIRTCQLVSEYETAKTFKISYLSSKENLTADKVAKVRQELIKKLQEEFNLELKQK